MKYQFDHNNLTLIISNVLRLHASNTVSISLGLKDTVRENFHTILHKLKLH